MPDRSFAVYQHAFNVGVVDKDKLHRVDLERLRLAAEQQTNWSCDAVGKMFLRPGQTYIANSNSNAKPRLVSFIAGQQAAYMLELTNSNMRVYYQDVLLTRPSVTSTVTSGDFSAGTGWTLAATSGQTSSIGSGVLTLLARAHGGKASCKQQVTTSSTGVEHALRVVVTTGPVQFKVGSTDGGDDYISETTLDTGTHSLAFVPTGSYWINFSSILKRNIVIDSCTVEASGVVSLPTIWTLSDLWMIRRAQSLDVMYCACYGRRPQKIERRGDGASAGHSWSVVDYAPEDGPFLAAPSSLARLTPGALEGNTTLASDIPFFNANMVGQLFRLYHNGQAIDTYLAGENQFTPTINVTGVNDPNYNERFIIYTISGTWVGTLRNQRSFDSETFGFHDFRKAQSSSTVDITANEGPTTNDDNEDNAITWMRFGFPGGKYTSGEAHVVASYNGGGGFGICRVTGYTSTTSVNIEVLTSFVGSTSTSDWQPGSWSADSTYPYAVALDDGRLQWLGSDKFWASISDAYQSFDLTFVGDAGSIDRAVALAGRNEGRWMVSVGLMLAGTDARIVRVGASSLGEAITPTNLTIRGVAPIGAAAIEPAALRDNSILFIDNSQTAIYELNYVYTRGAFQATQFSQLSKELFNAGITEVTTQDRPDQRLYLTMASGDAVMILHEPDQQVSAFIPISTSSSDTIVSQCVLPATNTFEDRVYRAVKRTVNSATVYTIEKVVLDSEALPTATGGKVMDCGVSFGAGSATISGLSHLIGRTVVAWSDGAPVTDSAITDPTLDNAKQFTVNGSGQIVLPSVPAVGGFVGLPYTARYKSARLAYGLGNTSPMLAQMNVANIGLLLADFCRSGVRFGTEFDNADQPLSSMPARDHSLAVASEVQSGIGDDEDSFPVNGRISNDTRVCIEAKSPKPVTILALLIGIVR